MTATAIHFKSFDGLDLAAFSYGPEKAALNILCLHGLTRNHKDFEPMITALNSNYRFIAVDVRGRGESQHDPDPHNYRVQVYVRDVVTLLEHLQLQRVVIIGTSMGGIMSMLLYTTIRQHIIGVVMNDIGPELETKGLTRIGSYVGKINPQKNWLAAAEAVKKINLTAFPKFADSDWMEFAKRTGRENNDGTVVLDYDPLLAKAFDSTPASDSARKLAWQLFAQMQDCPLLIIRGELSDLLSRPIALQMVQRHSCANLVEVSDVGHAPLLNEAVAIHALEKYLATMLVAELTG